MDKDKSGVVVNVYLLKSILRKNLGYAYLYRTRVFLKFQHHLVPRASMKFFLCYVEYIRRYQENVIQILDLVELILFLTLSLPKLILILKELLNQIKKQLYVWSENLFLQILLGFVAFKSCKPVCVIFFLLNF